MPGRRRSSGTGGTVQSPVLASDCWQMRRELALVQGPVEHVGALPSQVMNGGGEPVVERRQVLDEVVCEEILRTWNGRVGDSVDCGH